MISVIILKETLVSNVNHKIKSLRLDIEGSNCEILLRVNSYLSQFEIVNNDYLLNHLRIITKNQ